jgi:hypothetical protein
MSTHGKATAAPFQVDLPSGNGRTIRSPFVCIACGDGDGSNPYLDTAMRWRELGFSPLPPKEDGSKAPTADVQVDGEWTWSPYQTTPASEAHVEGWYRNGRTGCGVATGVGGLELFEFDDRATYDAFKEAAVKFGRGDLVERIEAGYLEETPGGGIHWFYVCDEVRPCKKLAERPIPGEKRKRKTLIETKGEGGFAVVAPSGGKVHPTGGAYRLLRGRPALIAAISSEERDALWNLAESFDEMPASQPIGAKPAQRGRSNGDGPRPGDVFEAEHSWEDILEPLGWRKDHVRGDVIYWTRPDKDKGVSATTGHCKGLYVFSTSTSFEPRRSYTKFGAYTRLHHAGDFGAAARELARQQTPTAKIGGGSKAKATAQATAPQAAPKTAWDQLSDADLGMRKASGISKKPIVWMMKDRIPDRDYTLIAGRGKQGKSQLTMAIGAKVSTGGDWWDGSGAAPHGHVLYLSAEDDPERVIVPRLEALGADLDNITILEAKYKIPARDGKPAMVSFTDLQDLDYWRAVLGRVKGARLIVVDPLPSYMGRGVNDRRNNDVRAILHPFIDLIKEFEMALLGVTHFGKATDGRGAIDKILDSIAYVNLARAIHYVARDPDTPGRVLFMPGPGNYARADLPAIAFSMVDKTIPDSEGGTITITVPEFDKGTVDVDPDDVVNRKPAKAGARGPDPTEKPKFAEWLIGFLKDKGPVFVRAIIEAAGLAGLIGTPTWNPKYNRNDWSNLTALYRAGDSVEHLPPPHDGWEIVTSKKDPTLRAVASGTRWALRKRGAAP